ncbi:MAG: ATP-binding protein [Cyanobacteria bacterium J06623_5]
MDLLPEQKLRPRPLSFLRSRLSQRIVLSVFSSIVAIEALILVPSVYRREQEFLRRLAEQSEVGLRVLADDVDSSPEGASSDQLMATLRQLQVVPMVVGGALYDPAGRRVDSFGELPVLAPDPSSNPAFQLPPEAVPAPEFDRSAGRYDTAQRLGVGDSFYWVVVRHDTASVRREVHAFIWRIFGLVVLISAVVTLTTMIVLRSVLIVPILALCDDLLQAAPAALQGGSSQLRPFTSARYSRRNDELGAVINAFAQMFERISRAIAQRQQAENQLRESENRFRTLVEQASESMLVIDEAGKIVDCNRFAQRILEYGREELLTLSVFDINPVFTPEDYAAHWQRLLAGKPTTIESVHRRKDGREYPVEVRSNFITIGGEQQVLSLVRDISDRKQAEKAQARLAEIGELAAMIVHEVRNPFTTVYMALSAFQSMSLPPRGQMRLELAMEESERLKRLLNEILAYSKEQRLAETTVDIAALCEELARSLSDSPAAVERQIQLIAAAEPMVVRGDRDKLKQVFINLVTNACEAISPRSTVTWRLQLASERQLEIQVHNGGDPIPPDVLPKLTQPFVSTKSNGNGLGLAITKRIIEAHRGQLKIESTAEQGTTVTVWLPLLSR